MLYRFSDAVKRFNKAYIMHKGRCTHGSGNGYGLRNSGLKATGMPKTVIIE